MSEDITFEPLDVDEIETIRDMLGKPGTWDDETVGRFLATIDARDKKIAEVSELLAEQVHHLVTIRGNVGAREGEGSVEAVTRALAERDAEIARLQSAVRAEREACAKVAEDHPVAVDVGRAVAKSIRARP